MPARRDKSEARPVLWFKRTTLLVVGVVLGIATLVFISLNRAVVSIDLYFGQPVTVPLWAVVVACLVLGWAIPALLGVRGWFRQARHKSRLRRRIDALESEVMELRNIPLDFDASSEPPPARRAVPRGRLVDVVTDRSPELLEAEVLDPVDDSATARTES